ncbi:MAG TPA: DUF2442 domain-containing protein [Candidatus Polarisedimenticolia bacterium]|nr:DUF2442 domain-containing protein [Candidatus Polarisedimenticolia bacterium]
MTWRVAGAEVVQISPDGLKVRAGSQEYFLDYGHFPWLENAPVGHVLNVELSDPDHLRWPDLNVEIDLEALTPLDPLAFLHEFRRDDS